jgi:hypothetical protein
MISNPAAMAAVQSESYAAIFGAENPTVFKNALQDYLEDTLTNTSISTKYLVHETGATANERSLKNDYFIDHVFSNLLNAEKLEVLIFLGTTSSSNFKVDIIQNSIVVQSTTITVTSSTVWNAIQLNNRLSGNVEVNITGLSTHTGDRLPTFTANAFQTVDGAVINPSSAYRHQYQWLETVNSRKWVCDKFEPDLCWWQPYTYTITHTDWTTETIQEVPAMRFSNQDVMLWKYTVKDAINGHFPIKKEYFVNGILNSAVEKAYVDYPSYNTYKVINQGVQPDFSTPTGSLDQLMQEFMVDEGLSTESMDVDAYLANLMTVVGGSTDPALEASVMSQSVNFLNQLKRPYNSTHGESYLITYYYPGGPEPLRWGLFRQLDWYEQVCIKPVGDDCPLLEYKTVHMYDKVEKMGDLTLATDIGFPESLETIILAKSTGMVTYPISPYFFTWLAIKTQQIRGIAFTQIFMNDLVSSTPISPLLNVKADLANSYQAAVNLTDTHGYSAMGSVPVQIQDAFGTVKGEGTVYNGYGYISATNAQFAPGDKAVVTGSGFYLSSQAVGTITQKPTTTSMSLVLDPEAATGVNPFVADITMKDSSDNMVMGNVPITIKDSNGNYVTSGTVQNGTARITLPSYKDTLQVTTGSSVFYGASSSSGTAQYDLPGMIRTLGPAGSNAVDNAKFTVIRDYIETSGAFTYNSATGSYTWNGNDKFGSNTGCYKWTDDLPWPYPDVDRGYCVISSTPIAKSELDSSIFTSGSFVVRKYYGAGFPVNQYTNDYTLSKMDFFTFWLGQKLEPTSWGGNPREPSGYTQLNTLASDFSVFLSKDQSYFQNDSGAQSFSAKVRGLLDKATKIGFPTPAGVLEQLADFINGIINTFLSAIATVWNAIVSFVGAVANFVMTIWNNVVGPVLGAAIEVVKNVVTTTLEFARSTLSTFFTSQPNISEAQTYTNHLFFSNSLFNSFNSPIESMLNTDISPISNILGEINTAIEPFLSSSSLGSLVVNLFNLPELIATIIDLFGVNAVYTIIQEAIFIIFENLIQFILSGLDNTFMTNLINLMDLNVIFSSSILNLLSGSSPLTNIDFLNVINSVFSFIDGLKVSTMLRPILEMLINSILTITMNLKSFLFLLLPVTPDLKIRILSSTSLNSLDIIITGTNKLITSYSLDLVSNIFSSFGDYIFNSYPLPYGGTQTPQKIAIIGGKTICDIASIYLAWLAWQLNEEFASTYGVDRFSQLPNNVVTFLLTTIGKFVMDIGFIDKYILVDYSNKPTVLIVFGYILTIFG